MKHLPWTHEELAALRQRLEAGIQATECEYPDVRPLPPMQEDEAKKILLALTETACSRQLTRDECFLIGQLLSCYRMAIQASMLKRRGRYFVFSEAELAQLMNDNK